MQASEDVLALAALEVNLEDVKEGNTVTVKWRGKPVFIKHRTQARHLCCSFTNFILVNACTRDGAKALRCSLGAAGPC